MLEIRQITIDENRFTELADVILKKENPTPIIITVITDKGVLVDLPIAKMERE